MVVLLILDSPLVFFNAAATSELYTLSLHDALPIYRQRQHNRVRPQGAQGSQGRPDGYQPSRDRKSTRLNSSHVETSYAVFCLKKKTVEVIAPREVLWPPPLVERLLEDEDPRVLQTT